MLKQWHLKSTGYRIISYNEPRVQEMHTCLHTVLSIPWTLPRSSVGSVNSSWANQTLSKPTGVHFRKCIIASLSCISFKVLRLFKTRGRRGFRVVQGRTKSHLNSRRSPPLNRQIGYLRREKHWLSALTFIVLLSWKKDNWRPWSNIFPVLMGCCNLLHQHTST